MKNTLIVNLYGGPGTGKCFQKGTQVLMWDGTIKPIEDIQVGDVVMGDDSTPRHVLELHRGKAPMYKLHRPHSQDIVVSSSHILSIMRYHVNKTWSYHDISIEDFLNTSKKNQHYARLYKVPVEYDQSNFVRSSLKIDPYYLGYWLGDGTSHSLSMFCTADHEIVDRFRVLAKSLGLTLKQHSYKKGACQTYCMSAGNIGNHANHPLSSKLYNLIHNKHIPHEYKVAPLGVRLELIAGLIDSDGGYARTSYDWINKNKQLAYDFYQIVNSCGLRATIHKCTKWCKTDKKVHVGEYYRVSITGDIEKIPVIIDRKKCTYQKRSTQSSMRECFKVIPLDVDDYYGFTTDGNNRFLLDDCTVVHNSSGAAYIFSKLKMAGIDAEYVTEFAKDKVWENNIEAFKCQFYITGKQSFRISRCFGKVDVIITDSPIVLGKIYADLIGRPQLGLACLEEADQYPAGSTLEIFLRRVKPYNTNGRNQTEEEAKKIDETVKALLRERSETKHYDVMEYNGDQEGYDRIYLFIKDLLETRELVRVEAERHSKEWADIGVTDGKDDKLG